MTGTYPRRFGKYVLLKPLAKGGMGEIYLAAGGEVGGFEKLCVIKKVLTEKADKGKSNRFLDEAKVVLRLSHAALVNTFDAGDVDGEFYIAMELVEGKDLREVWNRCVRTRQRIPLDVALHVVREVARALAYVHGYGDLKLVHRDVAPPNILLAYVGDVKLTDFGLARSVLKQEHTQPGVVFGRAAYLAPEQARGEVADARTDVYTLGIVLWELLTGQQYLQLAGMDPATALAVVRHPKVVAPSVRAPWITPPLDKVVMRALAPDRAERFGSSDEMRQALGEVIAQVAPKAEAGRVAEFLRAIYAETIEEERSERERFLKDGIPQFRADQPSAQIPLAALGRESASAAASAVAVSVPPAVPVSASSAPAAVGDSAGPRTSPVVRRSTPPPPPAAALRPAKEAPRPLREDRRARSDGAPGVDLRTLLQRDGRLDGGRAAQIGAQIARVLIAEHAGGRAHGGLAPECVLVDARGPQLDRVLDVSHDPAHGRAHAAASYSPYAPPERVGGGAADARGDIYALGALVYEMVTGAPPHAGAADPAGRKLAGAPQSPRMFRPEIPVALEEAILAALQRDPERRPESMAVYEGALVSAARACEAVSSEHAVAVPSAAGDERRRVRREAAFRAIHELAQVAPVGGKAALAAAPAFSAPPSMARPMATPAGERASLRIPIAPTEQPTDPRQRVQRLVIAGGVVIALAIVVKLIFG